MTGKDPLDTKLRGKSGSNAAHFRSAPSAQAQPIPRVHRTSRRCSHRGGEHVHAGPPPRRRLLRGGCPASVTGVPGRICLRRGGCGGRRGRRRRSRVRDGAGWSPSVTACWACSAPAPAPPRPRTDAVAPSRQAHRDRHFSRTAVAAVLSPVEPGADEVPCTSSRSRLERAP